jgi:uncharacterized membrane protein
MAEIASLVGMIVLVSLVVALAVPILIIWLIVTVIRNISGPPSHPRRDPAVEQLRYRLARGEITQAEFEQAMYNLGYEKVR